MILGLLKCLELVFTVCKVLLVTHMYHRDGCHPSSVTSEFLFLLLLCFFFLIFHVNIDPEIWFLVLFLSFIFFLFWDRISLFSPGWPWTFCVKQADIKLGSLSAPSSHVPELQASAITPDKETFWSGFEYRICLSVGHLRSTTIHF